MPGTLASARVPGAFDRGRTPYRTPAPGTPLRLAYVGQGTYFEACSLSRGGRDLATRFVEFRQGGDAERLLAELAAWRPHVVLVFRPEIIPAAAFAGIDAATLGFLTEPLPRVSGVRHDDLEIRLAALRRVDRGNFDRIVSFDPHIVETAEHVLPVWRSLPLPVDDRFYNDVRPIRGRPEVMFAGRSTPYREQLLTASKHSFDIFHVAFGVDATRLDAEMRAHHVGINLHNEPYPSFENRVSLHLAAGHLVLSEPLDPLHGLEPGIDFLEFSTAGELHDAIALIRRHPDIHHRVRVRGRRKAEAFRASSVYRRLMHDLLADLRAFGSERAPLR